MGPYISHRAGALGLVATDAACALVLVGTAPALGGMAAAQPTVQKAQEARGGQCGILLVSLSKSSGVPGDTFAMNGTWGATQGTKTPRINKGAPHDLQVLAWTPTKLTVKIPLGLEPGVYKAGVYCEPPEGGGTVYGTQFLEFEILNVQAMPDITSKKGIAIGGKSVPWGNTIALTETGALHGSPNHECAFNISYVMVNLTATATGAAFLNRIKVDAHTPTEKVVSIQTAQSLLANETKQINTQAYLPVGKHTLSLWLDDDHNVAERPPNGESNNLFKISYDLQGKCYQPFIPQK